MTRRDAVDRLDARRCARAAACIVVAGLAPWAGLPAAAAGGAAGSTQSEPASAARYTVSLRGGAADIVAARVSALAEGLELRGSDTRTGEWRELVAWDLVRGIAAEESSIRPPGSELLPMAEELWRARIRLERGDASLARPLLERHRARFLGLEGPTAQLVWEGTLRCAVDAGDLSGATVPWLECLRLGTLGTPSRFPALAEALDDSTGLLPSLPPFAPADRRAELSRSCEEAAGAVGASASDAARVAERVGARMARLMRLAGARTAQDAAVDAGAQTAQRVDALPPAERVLALLEGIVVASDPRQRARAVADFDRAFADPPEFLAAWRLAAIGTSVAGGARAAAGDSAERVAALESAALELLAVPASGLDRFGLVDAYALEEAALLMRESGNEALARRLETLRAERLSRVRGERPAA